MWCFVYGFFTSNSTCDFDMGNLCFTELNFHPTLASFADFTDAYARDVRIEIIF